MVEKLGFNAFSCGDSSGPPEDVLFESFCSEGVRFTHAYTPSTQSQAAIASLLTGVYPREHLVRHNGAEGLSGSLLTIGEAAKESGFKTSFISGGPPIFRRSGFNQGFDLFDDSIPLSLKTLYRPALNLVNLFLDWQKTNAPNGRFVSFLSFADLQFVDEPTVDDLGDVRESSYAGQVAEVSESVDTLVREMKKRKIWDTTTVILVGLNGQVPDSRAGESAAVSLFSDSTRATLMVKPARKANPDYVIPSNWKIDSPVSLVDLGETLFEMISTPKRSRTRVVSKMGTVSLLSAFSDPKPNWADDREIVVESAWPDWRGLGGVRASLRKGPYLYLFDDVDRLYNTLTDSLELRPLPMNDPAVASLREHFSAYLRAQNYNPWRVTVPGELERTLFGQELWRAHEVTADTSRRLRALTTKFPDNRELIGWRANVALSRGDWIDLKAAAGKTRPLWTYVAEVNLGTKVTPLLDSCFKALFTHSGERGKDCGDEESRALATMADDKRTRSERDRASEVFAKLEAGQALMDRISRANLAAGDVWDVSRGRWSEPRLTDLMLALPDMKRYRSRKNDRL